MAKPRKDGARLSHESIDLWLAADDESGVAAEVDSFLDAASVLSCFDPEAIHAVHGGEPNTSIAIALVDNSARLAGTALRQLSEAPRQSATARLGNRAALKHARAANQGRDDPLQRGIDLLIDSSSPPGLTDRSLADLLGLQQAVGWLSGITDLHPPDALLLNQRIEREQVLQPMRRLLANGFVGRKAELAQLRGYVGVLSPTRMSEFLNRLFRHVRYLLEERPPLFLFGPGGIGKSTLLAKFILDHADASEPYPVPFIYLDFDRASLDPRHTHTLMTEALAQIRAQFPEIVEREHLEEGLELESNTETAQVSKGAQFGRTERLIERLANLLDQLATRNGQPVLFVLDTFEEAQVQGLTAVLNVWNLLSKLMQRVDRIRIVVAGRRALPSDLPHEPIEITSFDEPTAIQFLEVKTRDLENGPIGRDDARAIFNLIKITTENGRPGAVPLSLALAARIVLREGLSALRSTVQRRRLFASITAEQQQGMLNTRVLQHLENTDPDLKKLVDPGLIVRRITPQVIRRVLAGPCEVVVADDTRAQELFSALAAEIGLVDADREPGALWHLPTVRRAMLPLLRKSLDDAKLRAIHDAAVTYYESEGGTAAQAEELVHRLSRGDPAEVLEPRWAPELVPLLRTAYDELQGQPKLWLAGKLGLEVDEALRAQADLGGWETQAEIRARSLLSGGLAADALAALRERADRTEASALPALEADALLLLGRPTEARDVVLNALERGESAADAGIAAALLTRLSTIDERDGRLEDALLAAEDAIASSYLIRDTLTEIGSWAAVLRLRRKLGISTSSDDTKELIGKASQSSVRSALRKNPAVLRELAAALGPASVSTVADALDLLGIDRETLVPLAGQLHALLGVPLGFERLEGALARLARREVGVNTAGLGREFARLLRSGIASPELVTILAGTIATNVETSLDQVIRSEPGGVSLSARERSELLAAITANLGRDDFDWLVYAAVDIDTRTLSRSDSSYSLHVEQIFQWLEQTNRVTQLMEGILRSTAAGPTLRAVATRLLAQRGLDQVGLAIDLNDLNGLQMDELVTIIVDSFDRRDLELLVSDELNTRLADLVHVDAPFKEVAFAVVRACQTRGWTNQLIAAIQRARPNDPLVASLVTRLSLLGVEGDRNLAGRSLEQIVAEQSPFHDVSLWATTLARLSGQVCLMEEGARAMATGFLVGPDLVLTAFHVAEAFMKLADNPAGSGTPPFVCRFDYVRESDGTHQGIVVPAAPDWLVHSAPYSAADTQLDAQLPAADELNYALLRLASPVGDEAGRSGSERRGWVDVGRRTEPAKRGETVFILQHPLGEPMRVSAGRILELNGNGTRVRYDVNTLAGSSGGPCIDAAFNLIAMHHAGVKSGPRRFNEGIPIGLIVEHLRSAGIALPAAAGPEASA